MPDFDVYAACIVFFVILILMIVIYCIAYAIRKSTHYGNTTKLSNQKSEDHDTL
jgi:Na+-transporting methylmalonyl-CoA/oxaloacetate decarboxylase gamma subunit